MEILIIIILILSLFAFAVRMTFFPKPMVQWLYVVGIALGLYWAYPIAIEESYSGIQKTMSDLAVMTNFSTLVIAEGLLGCLLSIFYIRLRFGHRIKKYWEYVLYFSGFVFFVALYYLESLLFINVRDMEFDTLAMILAVLIPLALLGLKFFVKWLVPQADQRTELGFFLHLAQILSAIALSVIVLKVPVKTPENDTHLMEFIIILGGATLIALSGYFYYHILFKRKWK